jgi:hypothetical protein
MTERLIMYALGRVIEPHDMPTVRAIVRHAAKDDYRFSSLVTGIVTSDEFTKARVPEQKAEAPVIKQAALTK